MRSLHVGNLSAKAAQQASSHELPITNLFIYYQFKLPSPRMSQTDDGNIAYGGQTVKAHPGGDSPHFDPVVVRSTSVAEETGLAGEIDSFLRLPHAHRMAGTRIARLRVIFALPRTVEGCDAPSYWPTEPLAYVEWYSNTRPPPDKYHNFCSVSRPTKPKFEIIPISRIRQTCHLVPVYGKQDIPDKVNPANALDSDAYTTFFINQWTDLFSYQTIW